MRGCSGGVSSAEILWSDVVTVAAASRHPPPFYLRQVRVSRPRIRLRLRFTTRYLFLLDFVFFFSFFQIMNYYINRLLRISIW